MEDCLYVVIPYFNFIDYRSGISNLNLCIQNLSITKNVKIVLVEGIYNNKSLPDYSETIFKHIKLPLKHVLWVKENLINIGFKNLPTNWKYGGWIDRDIIFCNPNWASIAIQKLQNYDIVQPWKEFLYLDKDFNYNTEDKMQSPSPHFTGYGFAYIMESLTKGVLSTEDKYKFFGHPGHAWVINKNFYNKIGGLYEYGIVGGGDGILSNCLKQDKMEDLVEWFWTLNFRFGRKEITTFHQSCSNAKIGYVNGLLLHNYHGSIKNRNYNYRYEILQKYNFEPKTHLKKDKNGILIFKNKNTPFEKELTDYFLSRKEDE